MNSAYDRALFRVQFGKLQLQAHTNGQWVLRFEAVVHNTAAPQCGRRPRRYPRIIGRLHGMVERFLTMLDCVDATFVADATLDDLCRRLESSDVYVSPTRDMVARTEVLRAGHCLKRDDAAAVITDKAGAYPPALGALVLGARHRPGS